MPPFQKGVSRVPPGTPQLPSLAEEYSYTEAPKPFKNPFYKKNVGRRSKNLKQILTIERERVENIIRERKEAALPPTDTLQNPAALNGNVEVNKSASRKDKKPLVLTGESLEDIVTYTTVEAPPSILPQKKYCDVTGLEGRYVDPRSTLRYHNAEIYDVIKTFQPAVIQSYLEVRGQGVVLR